MLLLGHLRSHRWFPLCISIGQLCSRIPTPTRETKGRKTGTTTEKPFPKSGHWQQVLSRTDSTLLRVRALVMLCLEPPNSTMTAAATVPGLRRLTPLQGLQLRISENMGDSLPSVYWDGILATLWLPSFGLAVSEGSKFIKRPRDATTGRVSDSGFPPVLHKTWIAPSQCSGP